MKDLGLVVFGMVLGWSLERVVPTVRPHLASGWRYVAAPWLRWARSRRLPEQWFRRSDAAVVAPTLPPRPQPGPRPVVGQRPSEGAHRARQRQARFVTRSFRSRR